MGEWGGFLFILGIALFVPFLSSEQAAGYLDYGICAKLQIPLIVVIVAWYAIRLLDAKRTKKQIVSRLFLTYILLTFSTNIFGEIFCRADHSGDLPIKTSLIDRYDLSDRRFVPPKKAEILRKYGSPIARGIPTKKTPNIPEKLRYCLNNIPDREVLVYKETDRSGRTFYEYLPIERTTQILRSPISIIDRDVPESAWPKGPLKPPAGDP